MTALLLMLWQSAQPVVYVPGQAVNRASDGHRSEGKSDAKDARISDRTRMITRLRSHLTAIFPGLEQALGLNCKGPLLLLAR
jgi:Transposase